MDPVQLSAERYEVERDFERQIERAKLLRLCCLCSMFLLSLLAALGIRQIFAMYTPQGVPDDQLGTMNLIVALLCADTVLIGVAGLARTYFQMRYRNLRDELAQFRAFP